MSSDSLVQKLCAELKRRQGEASGLAGWTVHRKQSTSLQRLYRGVEGNQLLAHQSRTVNEVSYSVTAYVTHGAPAKMGVGKLDIDPWSPVEEQVLRALAIARTSGNEPWALPGAPAQPFPAVVTADPRVMESPQAVLDELEAKAVAAAKTLAGVRVNSAELFVNGNRFDVVMHNGVDHSFNQSDLYFEAAMEKLPLPNTQEVHNHITAVSSRDFDLAAFLHECAEEARSLGNTEEPQTTEALPVILHTDEIGKIFASIVDRLHAAMEHERQPFYKAGDAVFAGGEVKGDRVTVDLDPFVEAMVESCSCTSEGQIPRKARVIENSVVREQLVNNRYGQYLKKAPNYITGNIVVQPGGCAKAQLRSLAPEVMEVVSFSSLLVDSSQLTWSSEIKLAKLYRKDGSVTLVKGGVMSGNVEENLADCVFSKETGVYNFPGTGFDRAVGYKGPAAMLIRKGVSIVGK